MPISLSHIYVFFFPQHYLHVHVSGFLTYLQDKNSTPSLIMKPKRKTLSSTTLKTEKEASKAGWIADVKHYISISQEALEVTHTGSLLTVCFPCSTLSIMRVQVWIMGGGKKKRPQRECVTVNITETKKASSPVCISVVDVIWDLQSDTYNKILTLLG